MVQCTHDLPNLLSAGQRLFVRYSYRSKLVLLCYLVEVSSKLDYEGERARSAWKSLPARRRDARKNEDFSRRLLVGGDFHERTLAHSIPEKNERLLVVYK